MSRPSTPPNLRDTSYSVKLSLTDMAYLANLKTEMGKSAIADVVREMVIAFRTTFTLPAYQVERLRADMRERGLNIIQYVQELLARRYEELANDKDPSTANRRGDGPSQAAREGGRE